MSETNQAVEDLKLIRRMIGETQANTGRYWAIFVIYGVLGILAALTSHWLLSSGQFEHIWIPWGLFTVVGVGASMLYASRITREARVVTFVERVTATLWLATLVTLLLSVVAAAMANVMAIIPGLIAIEIGGALFVNAALYQSRILRTSSLLWWTGGVVALAYPVVAFLIFAVLLAGGYLYPAFQLRRQAQSELEEAHS